MRWMGIGCSLALAACSASTSTTGTGGGTGGSGGAGRFTYTFQQRVFRIDARIKATPQNISTLFEKFGTGATDRWLVPSHNGAHYLVSTDRLQCGSGECLAYAPSSFATLELVKAGGQDVIVEGIPAINNAGDTIVYSAAGGPHMRDLFVTRKTATGWGPATLITGSSAYPYNNMPALSFDQSRVLFDCSQAAYPEGGVTDACSVRLDGGGQKVVVSSSTLPNSRQMHVQFPRDSLDGVLFESAWPQDGGSPETIWLRKDDMAPTPIGRNFNNAVSPCGLRDGRFGVLWLGGPGNTAGKHELALAARDGTVIGVLTPGVDVDDIGIGCSD